MSKEIIAAQPPQKRIKNFSEVALGFSRKQATSEAMRCPQPADPAHAQRCPLGIDILGFIRLIREGNTAGALEKIREQNPLAGVCGRVCSAPCETDPFHDENWAIAIRALERYVADVGEKKLQKLPQPTKSQMVCIVGCGPAGLTAAADLARRGYSVTIFEALHMPGGILRYGIPEFRLPQKILDHEIAYIQSLGVTIKTDCFIGQTFSIQELFEMGFSAAFLSTGAGVPQNLGISGENLNAVLTTSEFLMRINLMQAHQYPKFDTRLDLGEKIIVIGAGIAGIDCARIAMRLGKSATIVFERTQEELSKQQKEIEYAKEEGVKFEFLTKPLEILHGNRNRPAGLKCVRVDFADPDSSGQWQLIPVAESEFTLDADTVVVAGGHKANSAISKFTENLKIKKDGTFWTQKDSFATSLPGVFAGGSVVSGAGPLIAAMVSAKKAAQEMDVYLSRLPAKKQ